MKLFIGTGLLGASFIKGMLQRGDEVRVWNRTFSKAKNLTDFGAEVCADIQEAVKDMTTIHVCLKDDDAVNEVLSKAEIGLKKGAVIIDHTTTSVKGAIERTAYWKEKGFTYLHVPVLMGPSNALKATGYMLVSGDQAVVEKWEPELSKMTGGVINFGEKTGKAAGMKLIGNQFLMAINSGLSDTLNLIKSMGFEPEDAEKLFSSWDPGAVTKGGLKKILKGDFKHPSWELVMARKDARLMMEEASEAGHKLMIIPTVAKEMDKWIDRGYGHEDWTIFTGEE